MAVYQKKNQQQPQPDSNAPVAQFRCGAVSVAIWEQSGTNGTFYRVTPQRGYTKDEGKTWEHTNSFGRDEVLVVAELMRTAFNWICRKEDEVKRAQARQ